jgi:hypothetical protein
VKQIDKFGAKVDDALDFTTDIKLKPDAIHLNGFNLEYKSWKKGSFEKLMKGDQFKNQLKNYIHNGDFEYIFDKGKLLKDGVLDPDKFVKGEFQKVFKENAEELFNQNPDLFKQLNKVGGGKIENVSQFRQLIDDNSFIDQLSTFIKIE